MTFGGTYIHSLDSAGRFVMPLDFRNSLGTEFYVTKGAGCLYVFSSDYAATIGEQLRAFGRPLDRMLNPDISRLRRLFFSEMIKTNTDKQNRTTLTPEHRRFAGIQDEVAVCGCDDYVELWSPAALAAYKAENETVESVVASHRSLSREAERAERDELPQGSPD